MEQTAMKIKLIPVKSFKAFIAALLLTFFPSERIMFAATTNVGTLAQNHVAWHRLNAKEDNFSVLIPLKPEIRSRGEFTFGPNGERVSEERIASVYHNGVVYIIRMYESSNPKRLLSKYPEIFRLSNANESTVTVGGIEGKQYLRKADGYFHFIRLFTTKRHLYVLEAAARAEENQDVQRFLSSLTLGNMGAAGMNSVSGTAEVQSSNGASMSLAPVGSKPLTEKEVTWPAVMIYKPQPPYTSAAKRSRVSGTIKLRVVLSPSGEVTEVEVLKGLGGGLTEGAAEVVKSIRFLPAEKDGQLVPQYAEVEYNYKIF